MSSTSAILRAVHARSGTDLSCYRPATVERRIQNRMISLGLKDLGSYQALVERCAEEPSRLIERITIKVSRFYRNPEVFEAIRSRVLAPQRPERPLSVWSAGCARGEEAYTLAMLLEERGLRGCVTASDIDPFALAAAREGVYREDLACDLPAGLRERFLRPLQGACAGQVAVSESLKQRVAFELSDLTEEDAAPRTFDLVCCRNVLIYWSADKQLALLRGLLAKLRPGGFLCLGEAEWPHPSLGPELEAISPRLRLFRRIAGAQP